MSHSNLLNTARATARAIARNRQDRFARRIHLAAIAREARTMRERIRYRASLESLKHAITELLPERFQYSGYSAKVKAMILSYAAPDLPPAHRWNPVMTYRDIPTWK